MAYPRRYLVVYSEGDGGSITEESERMAYPCGYPVVYSGGERISITKVLMAGINTHSIILRAIVKKIVLVSTVLTYPLTYAKSYHLPEIGGVLANASGYVDININKHLSGNIEHAGHILHKSIFYTAVSNMKIISSSTKWCFKLIKSGVGFVLTNASGYVGRGINKHLSGNVDSESDRLISGTYHLLGQNSVTSPVSLRVGKQLVFIREGVGCVIRSVNKHTAVFMLETIGSSTKGYFESITSNIVGGGHISHKSIFYTAVSNITGIGEAMRSCCKTLTSGVTGAVSVVRVAVGGVIGSIFNKFYTYVAPLEYRVEDDE